MIANSHRYRILPWRYRWSTEACEEADIVNAGQAIFTHIPGPVIDALLHGRVAHCVGQSRRQITHDTPVKIALVTRVRSYQIAIFVTNLDG